MRQTRLSPVMTLDLELSPVHTKESIFQKGMLSALCNITRKLWLFLVFFLSEVGQCDDNPKMQDSEMITPGCNHSILHANEQTALQLQLLADFLLALQQFHNAPCVHWNGATWSSQAVAGQAPGKVYHVLGSSLMQQQTELLIAKHWKLCLLLQYCCHLHKK